MPPLNTHALHAQVEVAGLFRQRLPQRCRKQGAGRQHRRDQEGQDASLGTSILRLERKMTL
jgi:hypothetical protein